MQITFQCRGCGAKIQQFGLCESCGGLQDIRKRTSRKYRLTGGEKKRVRYSNETSILNVLEIMKQAQTRWEKEALEMEDSRAEVAELNYWVAGAISSLRNEIYKAVFPRQTPLWLKEANAIQKALYNIEERT